MILRPEMILTVKKPFTTRGLQRIKVSHYDIGDLLQLIRRTNENPWGDSEVLHWVVKCPYFCYPDNESVWLESMLKTMIRLRWVIPMELE